MNNEISIADWNLIGIQWQGNQLLDLALSFVTTEDETRTLLLTSVCDLEIKLEFDKLSGPPLVFEGSIEPSDASYAVWIDFGGAPEGRISLTCSEVNLS